MIWQEPAKGGYPDISFLGLAGIERMSHGRGGRIPYSPMGYLTELEMTQLSRGHSTFTMPASPWFANSSGLISGGVLAVIGDAALGSVVHSDVGPGESMTTAELSLSFVRPVLPRPDTAISGSGQLIHRGRTLGLSEAFLFDHEDRLVAHGTTSCTVFPPPDRIPDPPVDPPVLDQAPPGSAVDDPLRRQVEGEILPQAEFEGRRGLELLREVIAGRLPRPPIYRLTGLSATEAGEGTATVELPCSKWLSTSAGTVQGGFTAMLAESAIGTAVFTTAEPGTAIATLDLKVNYLRPVFPDGERLVARAGILHRGRTLAITAAEIANAEGKQVALATGSCMYLPGRPANLIGVELGSASDEEEGGA